MKREDFQREPCTCGACRLAGVDQKPQLRDPHSGRWLHGQELKRNYDAGERFWADFKKLAAGKAMIPQGAAGEGR